MCTRDIWKHDSVAEGSRAELEQRLARLQLRGPSAGVELGSRSLPSRLGSGKPRGLSVLQGLDRLILLRTGSRMRAGS